MKVVYKLSVCLLIGGVCILIGSVIEKLIYIEYIKNVWFIWFILGVCYTIVSMYFLDHIKILT